MLAEEFHGLLPEEAEFEAAPNPSSSFVFGRIWVGGRYATCPSWLVRELARIMCSTLEGHTKTWLVFQFCRFSGCMVGFLGFKNGIRAA